ncbi:SsrA-binding protein SmpB [Legionella waltersii]|uniref:SsrA-binding protein n=1 Tax=Legionella waltersii TaxID=66969 RepID=A0A0W1A520_9GAMM|nr:SsrA-binding protein SmpB [Legionella waltersii]KTD76344.1 SsrA-binding protein [Legionella waltersii]SNV13848.1 SsrA-binding protein [Legionella waltersii]
MTTKKQSDSTIVFNRKAGFEYFIEDQYEAGIALEGWEVKSLRAGKINISDSHIIIKNGEAFLLGAQINPLPTVSTHFIPDPIRTRKLLLNRKELSHLIGSVERQGYTIVPISLYWKKNKIKIKIALAKGKKEHDKRDAIKDRDWNRDRSRLMKKHS